jgi:N-acetylglutamate synthase-like GNAT family acetyltransferase
MSSTLAFEQLENIRNASNSDITRIARLIYQTDPYIYPAMFQTESDAVNLISQLIQLGNDPMFCLQNLYVAREKQNMAVIGIILWHKGSLEWHAEELRRLAEKTGIILQNTLLKAEDEYFSYYTQNEAAVISLINICVDSRYRYSGIGTQMLRSFVQLHRDEPMELYVLADNQAAIACYERNGFATVEECDAFTVTPDKPRCFKMERGTISLETANSRFE